MNPRPYQTDQNRKQSEEYDHESSPGTLSAPVDPTQLGVDVHDGCDSGGRPRNISSTGGDVVHEHIAQESSTLGHRLKNAKFLISMQSISMESILFILAWIVSHCVINLTAESTSERPPDPQDSSPSTNNRHSHDQDGNSTPPDSKIPHPSSSSNNKPGRSPGSDGGSPPPEQPSTIRYLTLFGPAKSPRQINEGIKALVLSPLATFPATKGIVYGFGHSEDVLVVLNGTGTCKPAGAVPGLVKIGYSRNYTQRMKQWRKQCKYYIPQPLFSHLMSHHQRVEAIVHLQLYNRRLREYRGCPGCGVRHTEWFRVDAEYAEYLVKLWKAFADSEPPPYGESGNLLPPWRERLEHVDLNNDDCWLWFIHGPPLGRTVSDYNA